MERADTGVKGLSLPSYALYKVPGDTETDKEMAAPSKLGGVQLAAAGTESEQRRQATHLDT